MKHFLRETRNQSRQRFNMVNHHQKVGGKFGKQQLEKLSKDKSFRLPEATLNKKKRKRIEFEESHQSE